MRGRSTNVLLVALLAGCASDPVQQDPPAEERAAEPMAVRSVTYAHPNSRFRFDVAGDLRVQRWLFDPSTPPHKVKERFELEHEGRLAVRIDVWSNPSDLPLEGWIDTYASHLKRGGSRQEQQTVGYDRRSAAVFDTPRSCQAPNVVTAVFVLDEHVVAVTCRDGEDPAARSAFTRVLGSFAKEGRQ